MACSTPGQDGRRCNDDDTHSLSFSNHDDNMATPSVVNPGRCAQTRRRSAPLATPRLFFSPTFYRPPSAPLSALPRRRMKSRTAKPEIRTISCHRRIKRRSNARATTLSSAYMWADVALLKLHCRPNDLDCWLGGSPGWKAGCRSISLCAGGESVLLNTVSSSERHPSTVHEAQ